MKNFLLKNKFWIAFIVGLILFIVYASYEEDSENLQMLKHPKFTIGTITSEWHSKTTFKTFGIDYRFTVDGYNFLYQTRDNSVLKGERYLVIYDSLNPRNINRFLTIYKVPNNIETPYYGWKYSEVPFKIDSNKIKNYIKEVYKNKVDK